MKPGLKLIGIMLIISGLAIIVPASTVSAADARAILGKWQGEYKYTVGNVQYPTNFTMVIQKVEKNTVIGQIVEPRTNFGPSNLKTLTSTVYGIWDAKFKKIRFIKTYDFPGGHSIYYEGKIGSDGRLAGKWSMSEDWSGSWSVGR